MNSKVCNCCGADKPLDQFYAKKGGKGGVEARCKYCVNAANKEWCKENKDRANARYARFKKKHAVAVSEKNKIYISKNRDAISAAKKIYYQSIKTTPKYKSASRIKCSNRRARIKRNGGKLSFGLVEKLMWLQRGICVCCRLKLGSDYNLDHIMPLALGGLNVDDNMQLLCPTCNNKKRAKHPIEYMQSIGYLL